MGEAWWQQIVAALTSEHVEHMVLVMTPAAMDSYIVRREWRIARQEGVCVLPVIASPDLDFQSLPHGMSAVHFTNLDIDEDWTRFIRTLEGHTDRVDAVAVTPNGKHAISGSSDKTLRVWDIKSPPAPHPHC